MSDDRPTTPQPEQPAPGQAPPPGAYPAQPLTPPAAGYGVPGGPVAGTPAGAPASPASPSNPYKVVAIVAVAIVAVMLLIGGAVTAGLIVSKVRDNRAAMGPGRPSGPAAGQQRGQGGGMGMPGMHGRDGADLGDLGRFAAGMSHGEFVITGSDGVAVTKRFVRGTITEASASAVTIKATDGFVGTFALTGSTPITLNGKTANASALTVGLSAMAVGTVSGTSATADRVAAQSTPTTPAPTPSKTG